jgi:putative ABC transport system permease protein
MRFADTLNLHRVYSTMATTPLKIVLADLLDAYREFRGKPWASLTVVVVLAAGMAGALFVSAVLNAMLFKPLPYEKAHQLHIAGPQYGDNDNASEVNVFDYQSFASQLALSQASIPADQHLEVAASTSSTMNLGVQMIGVNNAKVQTERFDGSFVSANLWEVLRVKPIVGNRFSEQVQTPQVAISHTLWQLKYVGSEQVIGQSVRLNGQAATIVAVMPEGFAYPRRADVWAMLPTQHSSRDSSDWVEMLVRVPDGQAHMTRLQSELALWKKAVDQQDVSVFKDASFIRLQSLAARFTSGNTVQILIVMLFVTLLILLLACLNAGNMLLSMKMARAQELSVRLSLGASRTRLVRHLFAHSALLAMLASLLALPIAQTALHAMISVMQDDQAPPAWMSFTLDWRMVLLMFIVACLTALAAGLWPAYRLANQAALSLRGGSRGGGSGLSKWSNGVINVCLLAGSGIVMLAAVGLSQAAQEVLKFNLGVRTEQRYSARLALFDASFPTPEARLTLMEQFSQQLRAQPLIKDVTFSTSLPGSFGENRKIRPKGGDPNQRFEVGYSTVDTRFLSTMETKLLEGRWFADTDNATSTQVAVIDQKFALKFFPNGSALGQEIIVDPDDMNPQTVQVIGVIEKLSLEDPTTRPEPVLLRPMRQDIRSFTSVIVHHNGDSTGIQKVLIDTMRTVDADTPLYWLRSYQDVITQASIREVLLAKIFESFSVIALILTASGLFGMMAFSVSQRTRELGLRRALGANSVALIQGLLRPLSWQLLLGLTLGALAGARLSQLLLRQQLGTDTMLSYLQIIAIISLLAIIALLASGIPALRALKIEPALGLSDAGKRT